jgi:hypothetical protein
MFDGGWASFIPILVLFPLVGQLPCKVSVVAICYSVCSTFSRSGFLLCLGFIHLSLLRVWFRCVLNSDWVVKSCNTAYVYGCPTTDF